MGPRSPHIPSLAAVAALWIAAAAAGAGSRPTGFARPASPGLGGAGEYTSVAVDAAGRAHVAWFDAARGTLQYAWQVQGRWNSEPIDGAGAGAVGWYASLALDAH